MQYPEFHSLGWPIGSGMVESANKNVVEARLKGPGMHWERKHVNPMLALRNTVCNDRWQEMWQKAVLHHRKLQSLQRSARAGQRATSLLPTCNPPSCPDSSSTALPSAASQEFAPPASFLLASEERSLPAPPSPPVTRPSSCRPSARRKRHTARNRVKYSHQKSAGVSADVCPCGTPLVRFKGHRPKQYCSDRCRQHAYRKQHTQTKPGNGSSRAPASHRQKSVAVLQVSRARVSSQRSGGVRGETCETWSSDA